MTLTSSTLESLRKLTDSNPKEACQEALKIILKLLDNVISDPSNEKYRRIRLENKIIKEKVLSVKGISELLIEIGFKLSGDSYYLPANILIAKLKDSRQAIDQACSPIVIEKPIVSSCSLSSSSSSSKRGAVKKFKFEPLPIRSTKPFRERIAYPKVIKSQNPFLKLLESRSDEVMQYEDPLLVQSGRALIPYEKLKIRAIEHLRIVHKHIKGATIAFPEAQIDAEPEPDFDDLMLYELAEWFKHEFFTWIDHAPCKICGNENTQQYGQSVENGERVEEYFCCNRVIKFYRYNDIQKLLQTRRGRCGEWANCFTFLCRCLGYKARYVYSTEDHVWTEVYSRLQRRWIHVDPSENVIGAPLMYEHGWKKDLKYVIAFSNEDVQDVTWRYSNRHKEILNKRTHCSEKELLETILALRRKRQEGLSERYIKFLKKVTLRELADFMIERQPTEDEKHGRSSGSLAWRQSRMETTVSSFHVFELVDEEVKAKQFNLKYSCSKDRYERYLRTATGQEIKTLETIEGWNSRVYHSDRIFKKYEPDWKIVYLAREEDSPISSIIWRFDFASKHLKIENVQLKFDTKTYESGKIDIFFLDKNGLRIEDMKQLKDESKFSIKAVLSGGNGDCAWQHTQLFRQEKDSEEYPFVLNILLA